MLVKDIIVTALKLLGKRDEVEYLSSGYAADEVTAKERITDLLDCYNLIADEIACEYFPLEKSEELHSDNGEFYFTSFSESLLEIKKVLSDKTEIPYEFKSTHLKCDKNKIFVTYEYRPKKKTLEENSDNFSTKLTDRIIAYGICAEYSLLCGLFEESKMWNERFKEGILSSLRKKNQKVRGRKFI